LNGAGGKELASEIDQKSQSNKNFTSNIFALTTGHNLASQARSVADSHGCSAERAAASFDDGKRTVGGWSGFSNLQSPVSTLFAAAAEEEEEKMTTMTIDYCFFDTPACSRSADGKRARHRTNE